MGEVCSQPFRIVVPIREPWNQSLVVTSGKIRDIQMSKDNKSIKQAAEDVLRGYLLRCFSEVSKQYPAVTTMNPEDGVEELLKLRRENKITIELTTVENSVQCTMQYVQ